jgi:hypothetical protein
MALLRVTELRFGRGIDASPGEADVIYACTLATAVLGSPGRIFAKKLLAL